LEEFFKRKHTELKGQKFGYLDINGRPKYKTYHHVVRPVNAVGFRSLFVERNPRPNLRFFSNVKSTKFAFDFVFTTLSLRLSFEQFRLLFLKIVV
jgi:hypothetical protein